MFMPTVVQSGLSIVCAYSLQSHNSCSTVTQCSHFVYAKVLSQTDSQYL